MNKFSDNPISGKYVMIKAASKVGLVNEKVTTIEI